MGDSDLDSAEEEMLASGCVPSSFTFEHKGPDSIRLQTSMEKGDPGDKALSPSTQLIRAAEPPGKQTLLSWGPRETPM